MLLAYSNGANETITSACFNGLPIIALAQKGQVMPRRVYSEINLHFVWHTKLNAPVITETIENRLYHYLTHRALQTPEVIVHAVGGTADHVHLAVSVPPTIKPSEWIGQMKGASSHHVNHEVVQRKVLEWQDGYGVVSFGTRDLPWVVDYISRQKEHHAKGSMHDRLERINVEEEG
jgi:putative transposase